MYGICRDCDYCRIGGDATFQWLVKMEKVCKKRLEETPYNEPVRDIIDEISDQEVICARNPVPIVLDSGHVYFCSCGCGEFEKCKLRHN